MRTLAPRSASGQTAQPIISGANAATITALVVLHLVAATVMIPTLAGSLRSRTDRVPWWVITARARRPG